MEGRNQLIKEFLGGTVGRIILELFGRQEEKYSAKIFYKSLLCVASKYKKLKDISVPE